MRIRTPVSTGVLTTMLALVAALSVPAMGQTPSPTLYGVAHSGADGSSILYTIHPASGAATAVGPVGFRRVSGISFHPQTGTLYGTGLRLATAGDVHVLLTVDPVSGVGVEVGPTRVDEVCISTFLFSGCGETVTDVAFRADGTLFGIVAFPPVDLLGSCFGARGLVTFDLETGAASLVGLTGWSCAEVGIAFSPDGFLHDVTDWSVGYLSQADGTARFAAGAAYERCGTGAGSRITGMDFHPLTSVLFGSLESGEGVSANCLATIDQRSGRVRVVGPTVTGLDALAWSGTKTAVTCFGVPATIVGTDGADVLVGTAGADVIAGLGGTDVIRGGRGHDLICGGPGDDSVFGGYGNDVIFGGDGQDTLRGEAGDDAIDAGASSDLVLGGPGDDVLFGDGGDDTLKGEGGQDSLHGGAGHDHLAGGLGDDWLEGGGGDDTLLGEAGNDVLASGGGFDTLDGGPGADDWCDAVGHVIRRCEALFFID
jgi:Ca2+-binding RTX toxin-like protein